MLRATLLAAILMTAGCSRPEPAPYKLDVGMQELMGHVLDPAADAIWSAAGYEITEAGERDLSPQTEEAWLAVENGAATVAETANLLMLPGRAPEGDDDWIRYSQALHAAGMKAFAAAEAKDKEAVFDTGGELYQACVACHQKYTSLGGG